MGDYEAIFVIKPNLKEEEVKNTVKAISEAITKNSGAVKKEEAWGKKPLTFSIKKFKEAYYYRVDFSAPPAAISKLDTAYKLNADILRTMITKR